MQIKCGSCSITPEWQMAFVHLLFINVLDILPINYTTPQLTQWEEIAPMGHHPHGGTHLQCADLGSSAIRWHTHYLWWFPMRAVINDAQSSY
jgi:hypothetical protein